MNDCIMIVNDTGVVWTGFWGGVLFCYLAVTVIWLFCKAVASLADMLA